MEDDPISNLGRQEWLQHIEHHVENPEMLGLNLEMGVGLYVFFCRKKKPWSMKNVGLPHVKWEADIEKARLQ